MTENVQTKILPMAGFEPRTSGIGSNRSTDCAKTTFVFSREPTICHLMSSTKSQFGATDF